MDSMLTFCFMQNKYFRILFVLGICLRLFLAFYNRSANDNHIDVISIIINEDRLPERNDCWSCYQPKFYYLVNVIIDKTFGVTTPDHWILISQLINVIVASFALYCLGDFIYTHVRNAKLTYALWALVLFNPCLIGITIQGTNDTFVISFGILAYYYYFLFVQERNRKYFFYTLAFILMAIASKASGWIIAGTVVIHFIYLMILGYWKLNELKWNVVICALSFVTMIYMGGYWTNWTKYKSDSLSTWGKAPSAKFFEKDTLVERPGALSLWDAFFTFRYIDMLSQPYINNEPDGYPLHRTSHWSQLYGRTFFAHFDQWPPDWQSQHRNIVFTGRVLLALSIIPLIVFLWGIFLSIKSFFNELKSKNISPSTLFESISLIGVIAFFAASVKYTMDYRDFSAMKSIYIFPALLLFVFFLIRGVNQIKISWIQSLLVFVITIICVFSIYDILFLAQQLYSR